MKTDRPHLDKGCPGKAYFERRDKELKPLIKEAVSESLGDVPLYMRMASGNRVWLVWLSAVVLVIGGILLAHLVG